MTTETEMGIAPGSGSCGLCSQPFELFDITVSFGPKKLTNGVGVVHFPCFTASDPSKLPPQCNGFTIYLGDGSLTRRQQAYAEQLAVELSVAVSEFGGRPSRRTPVLVAEVRRQTARLGSCCEACLTGEGVHTCGEGAR